MEEVPEPVETKGPRKATSVKRRKAKRAKVMSDRETKLAGLAAVKGDKEIGDLPSTKPLQKLQLELERKVNASRLRVNLHDIE